MRLGGFAELLALLLLALPPSASAQITLHVETVDSAGDVGSWTSLALDGQGRPHIAYRYAGNGYLKYASEAVVVPVERKTLGGVKRLYRP